MIAWKYLDKTSATIAAMRDYDSMRAIINNTPDEIKETYEKLTSPGKSAVTGLPSAHNPQAGAEKLAAQIDKLDVLRDRYSSAVEFMAWFEAAWGTLSDMDHRILREFYMGESMRSGANARLQSQLNYSEPYIEKLRHKALSRLSLNLFGK